MVESRKLSLDLNHFTPVFDDRFGSDTSLNKKLWTDSWGNWDQYTFAGGALTLTGYQDPWWQPVGFMQHATGRTVGEGYGLYQFSGYGNPGQGIGICFIMWRADNAYLQASTPGKATEIDILESWDKSQTIQSTIHYYDTGWANNNGQAFHQINLSPAQPHTYAMDWERDSLTFYVDGKQMYRDTTHVPLDAADGGCNEVMGAQVINEAHLVTTPTVQLHITDMSYSMPILATKPPPVSPSTIRLSDPGTLQEASAGAGVTVTETITATGMTTAYVEVLAGAGTVESAYSAVALDAHGTSTVQLHLGRSGDYIQAVDSLGAATVITRSAAVTITPASMPPLAITSLKEDNGRLLMGGDKNIGRAATLREFMDGKYIGVLRDNFADGAFNMHIADVTARAHVLALTLDGSSATATYDFTKQSNGSIVHAAAASTIASLPVTHDMVPSLQGKLSP